MIKKYISSLLIVFCLVALTGCNTMHGMGKDIEKLGDSIKKAAD